MGSNGPHGCLFLLVEKSPLSRTDEPSLDDGLSQPLNLTNGEQFAKVCHELSDFRVVFPVNGRCKLIEDEEDPVKLGKLLQPDASLVVNDILFTFLRLLSGNFASHYLQDMIQRFNEDSPQLSSSPGLRSC